MTQTFIRVAAASALALCGTTILFAQNRPLPDPLPSPAWESCDEMHDDYVLRFQRSPGFGPVRMWRPAMLDRSGVLDDGRTKYSLERIELIGLLKPDSAGAYRSAGHDERPQVHEKRALTNFEKSAVQSFKSGRGLASSTAGNDGTLHCVGALRAQASCLRCHEDKRSGDVVGAFTYQLRPIR
jgi:hypothetical protein